MENSPLVTIIVPMYGVEQYIGQCIDSLILQTYKNIEIILVDDGSPDNSGVIADNYAANDKRVHVIHQENSGVSVARNSGLDRATGSYVCFVDGDDALAEDFVEYMLGLAIENDADFVLSTKILMAADHRDSSQAQIDIWSPEKATAELLYPEIQIGSWNKLYRLDLIKDNGLRFLPEYFMGEGLNFITSVAQLARKIVATSRRVYYYRIGTGTSATTRLSVEKMKNALAAIDNIRKNLVLKSPHVLVALEFHYWLTSFAALDYVLDKKNDADKDFYEHCLGVVKEKSFQLLLNAKISPKFKLKTAIIWVSPGFAISVLKLKRKLSHK